MTDQLTTIVIGSDHAGLGLKNVIKQTLLAQGLAVIDVGTEGPDSCDYPDFAHKACAAVIGGDVRFGILVCGTGIGMSMVANRYADIRCALLHDTTGARLTRAHNDANMIALGARMTGEEVALDIVKVFLNTPSEGGRHARRVQKINPAEGAKS